MVAATLKPAGARGKGISILPPAIGFARGLDGELGLMKRRVGTDRSI
jgi:hypothetical protein